MPSNNKPTSGPWYAEEDADNPGGWVVATEDYTLAEGCTEPDARLFAAAPEMADALEVMCRVIELMYPYAPTLEEEHLDEYRAVTSALNSARALLAKIRGGGNADQT